MSELVKQLRYLAGKDSDSTYARAADHIIELEAALQQIADGIYTERGAQDYAGDVLRITRSQSETSAEQASYLKTRDCEHEWTAAVDTPGWERCPKCRAGRTVETKGDAG